MNKYKSLIVPVILIILLILGLRVRLRSYESFPPVQTNFDEQVIVWNGASLINNGVPTSWSFIPDYESSNAGHIVKIDGWGVSYDNRQPKLSDYSNFPKPLSHRTQLKLDGYETQFTMVQPQIEQPPIAGLLSALLSGSFKKNTFEQVSIKDLRVPVIALFIPLLILVFLITQLIYKNKLTSILASSIFTLTPTLVLSQRLAVAENYLTLFYLIGVLFAILWIEKKQNKYLWLALLMILISYLTKPFGISLAVLIGLTIINFQKPLKYLLLPITASLLAFLLYFSYGIFYGGQEFFLKIINYQTNRLTSPLLGIYKIIIPRVTNEIFLDGWVIFGWLSLLRSSFFIVAPVLSYILVLFIYGGEDYGWYRLPIYPFLSIGAAALLTESLQRKQGLIVWITFLFTVFATSLWWGLYGIDWRSNIQLFRFGILIILGSVAVCSYLQNRSRLFSYILYSILLILLLVTFYLNIQTINKTNQFWPTLKDITSVIPQRH